MKTAEAKRGLSPIYLDEKAANELPAIRSRRGGKRIVFGWYGGKFSHLGACPGNGGIWLDAGLAW